MAALTFLFYTRNEQGWPEPYLYSVYDRIYGNLPAQNTVYTLFTYGSGQPQQ